MPAERRKNARLGLAIPVRVQGFRTDGSTWEEFSTTDDVSLGGICFPLAHDVELGQILYLGMALPKRLRQYDLHDASYRVYTLVRSVRRRPDQSRVGVMFFGKYPPRGFHDRPGARYLLPSDSPGTLGRPGPDAEESPAPRTEKPPAPEPVAPPQRAPKLAPAPSPASTAPVAPSDLPEATMEPDWGPGAPAAPRTGVPPAPGPSGPAVEFHPSRDVPHDRRGAPRMEIFVNFTIQQVDEWGAVLQEELTVADNVGRGGARVMTTLTFREGDIILVQEAGGGFATRAEIRGVSQVQPGTERLHLRFMDRLAPERLLRQ